MADNIRKIHFYDFSFHFHERRQISKCKRNEELSMFCDKEILYSMGRK